MSNKEVTKKDITKEGSRVAAAIKGNKSETEYKFYVSDVGLGDNVDFLDGCATSVKKTLGKNISAFMLISAGEQALTVLVDVPTSYDKVIALEWLKSTVSGIEPECMDQINTSLNANGSYESSRCTASYKLKIPEKDEDGKDIPVKINMDSPFKSKDIVRSYAFSYLRKNKLLVEEESDDELPDFEDFE
jgi:hypothetical protein